LVARKPKSDNTAIPDGSFYSAQRGNNSNYSLFMRVGFFALLQTRIRISRICHVDECDVDECDVDECGLPRARGAAPASLR
jgi:hypothetical protein